MQLTLWTYEGPPHVGAMRVATSMRDVHYVLHAPQGDTYADLLFTMIERSDRRPPVTYTTFQARDLGGDTAELFKKAAQDAFDRFQPAAMLVGASCTAELIQDDPGGLAEALNLPVPVIPLELPAYQKKENWGAAETFYQLVRRLAVRPALPRAARPIGQAPRCNLLGATALGFRNRDDVVEITRLLAAIGVEVNVTAPMGATPEDLARLGEADFNVVLYPEVAHVAANWMTRNLGQPATRTLPIGVAKTRAFIQEVAELAGLSPALCIARAEAAQPSRSTWYAASVDANYLTGKRVFIFGDASHAIAAATVATRELGFEVVGLGTYSREFAREVRDAAAGYGLEALISDDYLEVEARIAEASPELVLGTQMERHIAKRLGLPCAVISAPVHVQDFPARYAPQMGFEGAQVIFDTWVQPLMMGLEEHLLGMFRGDFEFHEDAAPSHLGHSRQSPEPVAPARTAQQAQPERLAGTPAAHDDPSLSPIPPTPPTADAALTAAANARPATAPPDLAPNVAATLAAWSADAERELGKIPFFVRGKARRNTERFALERRLPVITVETLYDAKAHFSR
jgi:light-independent protochlorophyllide reductase subunit B